MFKKIRTWFLSLFQEIEKESLNEYTLGDSNVIVFKNIEFVENPPEYKSITYGDFYCVGKSDRHKWIVFSCPCGCGEVITLSAQSVHDPHWYLTKAINNRPTLFPSIWRDVGCLSHFWVKNGKVIWCKNTGLYPSLENQGELNANLYYQ